MKQETVEEYLARGGVIRKVEEGKAEGVWTANMAMTRLVSNTKIKEEEPTTQPLTGKLS